MKSEMDMMTKLSAFRLFKTKGMAYVEKGYPELVDFVKRHESESYDEVQRMLLENAKHKRKQVGKVSAGVSNGSVRATATAGVFASKSKLYND